MIYPSAGLKHRSEIMVRLQPSMTTWKKRAARAVGSRRLHVSAAALVAADRACNAFFRIVMLR